MIDILYYPTARFQVNHVLITKQTSARANLYTFLLVSLRPLKENLYCNTDVVLNPDSGSKLAL